MNGIFAPGEEALFVSPSPNLTGATLDLTGAVAPVSFTGAFGTIFLSPTLSTHDDEVRSLPDPYRQLNFDLDLSEGVARIADPGRTCRV